ncbi:MAG TPA: hypothetical protein VHK47_00050 [Polyangia bacterium]|jgi:hypothetical protein|nr:hypothetical protein [Polyangia bacterium]
MVSRMEHKEASYMSAALGIWELISTFIWHHNRPHFVVSLITGIVIAIVALASLGTPRARVVNVFLGLWLIVSGFAFPHATMGTVWNNIFVGVVVCFLAILGPGSVSGRPPASAAR